MVALIILGLIIALAILIGNIFLLEGITKKFPWSAFVGVLFFAKGLGGIILGFLMSYDLSSSTGIFFAPYFSKIDPYLIIIGIVWQAIVIIPYLRKRKH